MSQSAERVYDYVLVVGPGRSGTTFLYRHLSSHPAFTAPHIKEAHYYRSARRLRLALRTARGSGAILLDVADTAWRDPKLESVTRLTGGGLRILVVVLLRSHRERARSLMAYQRSRVIPALLAASGGLQRAVLRDSLTPAALDRLFALGVDVLVIGFEALVGEPGRVLDAIARLCAAPPFGRVDTVPVNRAEAARFPPLAAAAKLTAAALRALGARRLLQALKDNPRLVRLVFRPARPEETPALGDTAAACLDRRHAACRAAIQAACERLDDGLWLARGASGRR